MWGRCYRMQAVVVCLLIACAAVPAAGARSSGFLPGWCQPSADGSVYDTTAQCAPAACQLPPDAAADGSAVACVASEIGEELPVFCVGAFDVSAGAAPARLLYMRDTSPSFVWVAAKYVSAHTAAAAPEMVQGHSGSFNYHVDQSLLQLVAAAAADVFMREDESLVAAVMRSDAAFQHVQRNILGGQPWFKDTHDEQGLDQWMRPLHEGAHVPDVLPLSGSAHSCSYSLCLQSPEWLTFPCRLWTRVFMSCYNGHASHADLSVNWRLKGDDFFTAARAHSIWFKLPAALLQQQQQQQQQPVASDCRAAARQGFVDGMLGGAGLRRMAQAHEEVVGALQGKRVVMLGDSNMRYQYLDLAYFICFGVWPSLSLDTQRLHWLWRQSYLWNHDHAYSQTWHESFLQTTAAFRGLQQCDCFRPSKSSSNWKQMSFEGRVTRCSGITLEYHQLFGGAQPLSGRLPLHAPSFSDAPAHLRMESVCSSSSSTSSSNHSSCLGDGRLLWGGDIMDCAPPGVTAFDVLPVCEAPWEMSLLQFLQDLGGNAGGVDLLLLNYGACHPLRALHVVFRVMMLASLLRRCTHQRGEQRDFCAGSSCSRCSSCRAPQRNSHVEVVLHYKPRLV